jgi:membrane-bound ClpP family serine protease
MAAWKYFLIGLGIGVLGAILWIVASIPAGIIEGVGGGHSSFLNALIVIGFTAMFVGPLTFWIILPIRKARKKRRSRSTGGGLL